MKCINILYFYILSKDRTDIAEIPVRVVLGALLGFQHYMYESEDGDTVIVFRTAEIRTSIRSTFPGCEVMDENEAKAYLKDLLKEKINQAHEVASILGDIALRNFANEKRTVAPEPKVTRDDYTLILSKGWWWIGLQTTPDTYILQPQCGRFYDAATAKIYLNMQTEFPIKGRG